MYLDKENLLCEDMAITDTDKASTNVIDMGAIDALVPAPNEKGEIEIFCQVTEDFAGGTSLVATLQQDNDEAFGSAADLVASAAILTATLVAGYRFKIAIPKDAITERYIRLYFDVTGTMSAGKVTAGFGRDLQTNG